MFVTCHKDIISGSLKRQIHFIFYEAVIDPQREIALAMAGRSLRSCPEPGNENVI